MDLPVLPLPLRRTVRDPIYTLGVPVILAVLAVLCIPAWLLGLATRRRRPLRFLLIAMAAVVLDFGVFARCGGLWVAHRLGRRSPDTWYADHIDVVARGLDLFVRRAHRLVGFVPEVTADVQPDPQRPMLVLARHAGVGDSLVLVWLITSRLRRTPRVVLKRMLLWDPAMDLALRRLGAYFLPPPRVPDEERDVQLSEFARKAGTQDAILLFPEGRNWTPGRHEEELAAARAEGDEEAVAWIKAHPTVLDPHTGALRRILGELPDPQGVVAAHYGLETLSSIPAIWSAVPLTEPVRIDVRATTTRPDDLVGWLREEWAGIDARSTNASR